MPITRPLLLFTAILSLHTATARAWGPEGHSIVARIAEHHLSDGARSALASILAPGQSLPDNMVCNWPDYIKHDETNTAPWHYVDIPYEATAYVAARDCTNGQCVVEQITRLEAVLADAKTTPEDRLRTLAFLVHLVADIHQPLHCISRDDDQGGNLRPARWPGVRKKTNLHALWDSNLVRDGLGTREVLDYADALDARITAPEEKAWMSGAAADWAIEGHDLAVKMVYRGVPVDNSTTFKPNAAYIAEGRDTVERQLKKAGIRLAALLNRALN